MPPSRPAVFGSLLLLLAGCAPAAAPAATSAPSPVASAARPLPLEIRWTRQSAEHRAIFAQVYTNAGRVLDSLARGRARGTWAVILDADETVLDNSEYQRRRAALDSGYSAASWAAWTRERAAQALPGAVDFLQRVHRLGGRVAIVTNRTSAECEDTRANLGDVQLQADVVLCKPDTPQGSDKNPRFAAVQAGTDGLPPLEVLLWIGDNIQDFPGLSQSLRDADASTLAPFGRRYFLLPNTMYGSWDH